MLISIVSRLLVVCIVLSHWTDRDSFPESNFVSDKFCSHRNIQKCPHWTDRFLNGLLSHLLPISDTERILVSSVWPSCWSKGSREPPGSFFLVFLGHKISICLQANSHHRTKVVLLEQARVKFIQHPVCTVYRIATRKYQEASVKRSLMPYSWMHFNKSCAV